ncbi:hypothetical protein AF383_24650, partial [Salmonella enterica subsp. enterica serovar Typhimurium]
MLRSDTLRHVSSGMTPIVRSYLFRQTARHFDTVAGSADNAILQVLRRAADKARHDATGRFFIYLY